MTIRDIVDKIDGKVLCGEEKETTSVEYAFASDLMSDVLTVDKDNLLLITGLANLQIIRTSEMSDISCIVIARDKKVGSDIISAARENDMILVESPHTMFHIAGKLYGAGVKAIY